MADCNFRIVIATVVIAVAGGTTIGCSSEARPVDLTVAAASALIAQRWSQDDLNHFGVSFHSDELIECGVKNDLWKLVEGSDRGYAWTAYRLTPKGTRILFAIDLKTSGKGHEITLRGPYRFEITGISPAIQPDSRIVELRWEIDWDRAPADLKACLPKFELSGHEVALFKLNGPDWRFVSYLKPEDASAAQGVTPVTDKLP